MDLQTVPPDDGEPQKTPESIDELAMRNDAKPRGFREILREMDEEHSPFRVKELALELSRVAEENQAMDMNRLLGVLYRLAHEGARRASDEVVAGRSTGEEEARDVLRFEQAMLLRRLASEAKEVADRAVSVLVNIACGTLSCWRLNSVVDCSRLNSDMGHYEAMTEAIGLLERER